MRVLNRIVELHPKGLTYETDPRHVDIVASSLRLTSANSVGDPWCEGCSTRRRDSEGQRGGRLPNRRCPCCSISFSPLPCRRRKISCGRASTQVMSQKIRKILPDQICTCLRLTSWGKPSFMMQLHTLIIVVAIRHILHRLCLDSSLCPVELTHTHLSLEMS